MLGVCIRTSYIKSIDFVSHTTSTGSDYSHAIRVTVPIRKYRLVRRLHDSACFTQSKFSELTKSAKNGMHDPKL